jgi:DNA-binding response OmpR family regulator
MESVRILIIDDDVDALRLIGMMLEHEGFQILVAASGRQAIDKAIHEKPELIILDVMMPDMDGYQVATQLRKHPTTEEIPILMFTAKSGVNDKVTGFQAGVDDFLTKPVHPAELIARIKALLQRKRHVSTEPERGHIVSFLPTKGGLGTSSLALNVALELKKMSSDKQVALVEFCEGRGTLALQLGMNVPGGVQTLTQQSLSALTKEHLADCMIRDTSGIHLLLSTSKPQGVGPKLTRDYIRTILRYLSMDYDYVLLDLPATLDAATAEALRMTNEIILTLDPNRIGIALAQAMLKSLDASNIGAYKVKLVLIHRAPVAASLSRFTIEDSLQHTMICSIPPVPDLAYESAQGGKPMVMIQPHGLIAQQVRLIVQSIARKG